MRKLWILKTILDFLFIILIMLGAILALCFGLFLFSGDVKMLSIFFTVKDIKGVNTIGETEAFLMLIIIMIVYGLFVYSIFVLRKIIRLFTRMKLFEPYVIKGFHRMGLCFVLIACLSNIPVFLYKIFQGNIYIEFHSGLGSFLSVLCLGLFFMILSTIFKIAKHAKEENELTI